MPAVLVTLGYALAGGGLELGWISGPVAVVAAVGVTTALYTGLLVVRALQVHANTHSFGPCRGVGFLGMAVLAGGLSMIAAATTTGPRATYLVAVGAAVSAALFQLGLLLLPGAAPTLASRLRRVLDGAAIGICLFLAAWIFVITPLTRGHPALVSPTATAAILLAMVLSAALAVSALTGARAVHHRRSAWFCSGGAAVALLQHGATALLFLLDVEWSITLAATAVWAVGPALIWLGAHRSAEQVSPTPRPTDLRYGRRLATSTIPLLMLSGGLAVLAAFYHVLAFGAWGVYTALIATSAAAAFGMRGLFATWDVARYTARLNVQETRFLTTDALTGIGNRLRLRHRLDVERARVAVGQRCGTLLVIDLDDFGELDDVHGHDIADTVLMEVARRLRVSVGPADLAVRLAGDSFAVLTTRPSRQADALATRLAERLAEPYHPAGAEPGVVHLTTSIGVAECNAAASVDEMIRCAELAVSVAKDRGGDRVERYDESLELRVLRRQTFATDLRTAVRREQLDLLFSPVTELSSGVPIGLRAQPRWLHPTLGEVAHGELVTAAEDTGLLIGIGDWVLREACRQLGSWLNEGRDLRMSVTISAAQLRTPGFAGEVMQLRRAFRIPRGRLLLEVSERDLPPADAVIAPLAALQEAGVRTGLADFGSGCCPLIDLPELPLDVLRIDGSLVARLDDSEPIVATIAGLGRRLGLDVIADGVCETCQAQRLAAEGCRYGHGPLFSRPVPAERVEAYLDAHTAAQDPRS